MNGPSLASVGQLTDIDDSARNPLGTVQQIGSKEYIYLQGCASTVATDWVTYDEAFLTTRSAASAAGPVAVALAAVVANKFGWYQIGGSAQANAGTVADNGKVFLTATAGRCDDTSVAGDQVVGAIWRSTDTSNVATVQLFSRPIVGVNVA